MDWLHVVLVIVVGILAYFLWLRMNAEADAIKRLARLTPTEFGHVRKIMHDYRVELPNQDIKQESCLQKLVDEDWLVEVNDGAFIAGLRGEYYQSKVITIQEYDRNNRTKLNRPKLKIVPINDDRK